MSLESIVEAKKNRWNKLQVDSLPTYRETDIQDHYAGNNSSVDIKGHMQQDLYLII